MTGPQATKLVLLLPLAFGCAEPKADGYAATDAAESRDSGETTPTEGGASEDAADAATFGSCSVIGAFRCADQGAKDSLICDDAGLWVWAGTCPGNQVCDPSDAATRGLCRENAPTLAPEAQPPVAQGCDAGCDGNTSARVEGYVRADGVDAVVYRSGSGHTIELKRAGTQWVSTDLAAVAQPPPPLPDGDGYAVYARSDGRSAVLYRTDSSGAPEIDENSLQGTQWSSTDLSEAAQAPPCASDPFGGTRSDGTNSVLYVANDGRVWSLDLQTSGAWLKTDLMTSAGAPAAYTWLSVQDRITNAPAPFEYVRSDGVDSNVYVGVDGDVHEIYSLGGSWHEANLTDQAGSAASKPTPVDPLHAYVRGDRSNAVVYAGDSDGHVYELVLSPTQEAWTGSDLTYVTAGAPAPAEHPAGYTRSDGTSAVVYLAAAHIHELALAPDATSWVDTDLTAQASAPDAASAPSPYVRSDGVNAVVFVGIDNRVHELGRPQGTGTWKDTPLN